MASRPLLAQSFVAALLATYLGMTSEGQIAMAEKRGNESWIGYQVRQIKMQVLEEVRGRVDAAIPTLESSTTNLPERLAGHAEMKAQARNIINSLIEESNLATGEHDKRAARARREADRSVSSRQG